MKMIYEMRRMCYFKKVDSGWYSVETVSVERNGH